MDITGLGSIADLIHGTIDKIWPDKTEAQKNELALAMAVLNGQLQMNQAQTDVNKVEAANPSVFVSGWRPFIGWVCGSACAWNWIGLPIAVFGSNLIHHPIVMAPADLTQMLPILMGMLGLGALRTYEKTQGVART